MQHVALQAGNLVARFTGNGSGKAAPRGDGAGGGSETTEVKYSDGRTEIYIETVLEILTLPEFSRTCVKTVRQEMALEAVKTVAVKNTGGQTEIDIKKYCKVEKIPGGSLEDCRVLKGVMFNKVGLRFRTPETPP